MEGTIGNYVSCSESRIMGLFIGIWKNSSNNVVGSTVFLMIVLQKYPLLHKFLDEEKQYDVLEKAMNQNSGDI